MSFSPNSKHNTTLQARATRSRLNTDDFLDYELGQAVRALPPRYTRLLASSITLLLLGTLAWAHLSKIDAVAVAPGELVPSTQVRPIRAIDKGVILNIAVRAGDAVKAGEILVTKDTTLPEAEVERLKNEIAFLQQDIQRLEAEWQGSTLTNADALQNELLNTRARDYLARLSVAQSEVSRQQAAIQESTIKLERLAENQANAELTLASAQERESGLEALANPNTGAVSRLDYLDAKDRLIQAKDAVASLRQDQAAQKQAILQAQAGYSAALETVNQLTSQDQSAVLSELNRRRQEKTALAGQLSTAQVAQQQEVITAPFNGTVYNVSATQGPVQAGEELLSVLPDDETLVLEVKILNRDIGFIESDQRAKVKIATFPFQEFGVIEGKVVNVSPNATLDPDLGPIFMAKVQLQRSAIDVHGRWVSLVPGMTGTAEIVIRERSVLQLLLEPITRKFSEASSVR